jgi:hypothetical protein
MVDLKEIDPCAPSSISDFLQPTNNLNLKTRVDEISDLVFVLIAERLKKAGGDIDKVITEAKRSRDTEAMRQIEVKNEAYRARLRRLEAQEKMQSDIVKKAFREGLRPSIQGVVHEWDETLTFETDRGPVKLLLSDLILSRASEFVKDAEQTKASLINRYSGSGYLHRLMTKDFMGAVNVPIKFVAAGR